MDINKLFKSGMRHCGRVLSVLPQKDIGSPLIYMQEILKDETLPSLNILLPRLLTKSFPIYALNKVADGEIGAMRLANAVMDNRYCAFRVPRELVDGADIVGVKDCFLSYGSNSSDSNSGNFMGVGVGELKYGRGRFSSADVYARSLSGVLQYADAQLVGTMTPQLRYKFFEPNILWLNKPYGDSEGTFITVTFKLANDENLTTVPNSAYEGVKKLFILDLKKSIYNEYSPFSEIETPNGATVNIRIDDWSSAEADRDQQYETMLATSHFRNSSMRSG